MKMSEMSKMSNELVLDLCENILKETILFIKTIGIENQKYVPEIFLNYYELSLHIVYSENLQQTLVIYFLSGVKGKNTISFEFVDGDPFPGISMKNSKYITFKNVHLPNGHIGYAFLMESEEFSEFTNDIENYFVEYVFAKKYKKSLVNKTTNLESIGKKFKELLDEDNITEKIIEDFFFENKEILELTLQLDSDSFIQQPLLKREKFKFGQDLKPDLIAYNYLKKRWVILDYKRSKENIAKNHNKVRSGVKAIVNDLCYQLDDYVDYFDEENHRNYFKDKYKKIINKPHAIGIIGKIEDDEVETIDRVLRKMPSYVSIYTYNMILDSYMKMVNKINGY